MSGRARETAHHRYGAAMSERRMRIQKSVSLSDLKCMLSPVRSREKYVLYLLVLYVLMKTIARQNLTAKYIGTYVS